MTILYCLHVRTNQEEEEEHQPIKMACLGSFKKTLLVSRSSLTNHKQARKFSCQQHQSQLGCHCLFLILMVGNAVLLQRDGCLPVYVAKWRPQPFKRRGQHEYLMPTVCLFYVFLSWICWKICINNPQSGNRVKSCFFVFFSTGKNLELLQKLKIKKVK